MNHRTDDSKKLLFPDPPSASSLGLGLFLASAVILFGVILTGYALVRVNDPGAFASAPALLDRKLGAVIATSLVVMCLAAAGALRSALGSDVGLARRLLTVALLAGLTVLAARAIEFPSTSRRAGFLSKPSDLTMGSTHGAPSPGTPRAPKSDQRAAVAPTAPPVAVAATGVAAPGPAPDQPQMIDGELRLPHSILPAASNGPTGSVRETITLQKPGAEGRAASNIRRFFSLLLLVNGLHTIYLVFGVVLGVWLLVSTGRGRNPRIPIAMAAAYWAIIGAIGVLLIPAFYV